MLFDEVEVLRFEVVGKGAVCDGVVVFEGAAGGAGEAVCGGEEGGIGGAARGEGGAGAGA